MQSLKKRNQSGFYMTYNKNKVQEIIRNIASQLFHAGNNELIKDDFSPYDRFDIMELTMNIEETFSIIIADEEIEKLLSFNCVIELVCEKLEKTKEQSPAL
jgi:acyl carrier protein